MMEQIKNQFVAYQRIRTANYEIREEMLEGKKHLVVPVVMMVEGVHHGNRGPIYHSEEELSRFVEAWNGQPVTVGHPEEGGQAVSASASPDIRNRVTVGTIYNATYKDGLRAELWLDEQRLAAVSPLALAYIVEGNPLDVSVGVFSDSDFIEGEWNGEHYVAIAHNHRPDHLALLPGEQGACSWDDGCGIRLNKEGELQKNPQMDDHLHQTGFSNNKKREEQKMACCEGKVDNLIANKLTRYSAKDKEWLMELNEDQIDKLEPIEAKPEKKTEPTPQVNKEDVISEFKLGLTKIDDYTALMPEEMRAEVEAGVALYKEKRNTLIEGLTKLTKFSAEELGRMDDATLDKLNESFEHVADYSGQGAGGSTEGTTKGPAPLKRPSFATNKKKEE